MKKTNLYAKKTLSVFMAVMMLLSAWVFVPGEHNHAGAVSSDTISATNTNAVSKYTDASFNTSFTTVSGNFQGDNASTMASRGYYKNVLYSPHFPASNNNLTNNDSGVYFGTLGSTADGARVWYPETTLIWDGSTTPQIPILFDIDSNNNNRVGVKNVYISSGANGLVFRDSYWTAKSECAKDTNYYTHFTFDWIMQNNPGNYWISTSSGNDKESMCSSKGYWDIYGTYLQYTGGSFGSGSTYYKAITPTWVCRTGSNYTGTTNKTIYVIDYVPLKNALNDMKNLINEVKANPAKYTTASVSALASAADKLIAAKPNNYINSSVNDVYNWNSAVSSALSAYNSAKKLVVQKYTLTFNSIDGTATTYTYDYGTSINCYSLAPANSIAQLAGNDSYHQPYEWDVTNMGITSLVDDIIINEIAGNRVGHSFPADATQGDKDHSWTCSVCGYVKTQAHNKNKVETTDSTCSAAGEKTYSCSSCAKVMSTETIPQKAHTFSGDYKIGTDGKHYQTCSVCGVSSDGEAHVSDEGTVTIAPGCLTDGEMTYKCKICEAELATEVIVATGHRNVTKTEANDVSKVCNGKGNEEFYTCSDCGKVYKSYNAETFVGSDEVTDLTDTDGDNIPDVLETDGPPHEFTGAYVSVTPGENGTHKRQCAHFTQCGAYSAEEPHKYSKTSETPATCTATGEEVYKCTDCGQEYKKTLDKIAHVMTKTQAVAAGCLTAGNNEYYTCSTCNKVYKDEAGTTETTVEKETIKATGHKWTGHHDYDTIKDYATCQSEAVYYDHCDVCQVKLTSTHTYGNVDLVNGHKFDGAIRQNADRTHSYKCTVEGCTEYGNATTCTYKITADVASTCKTAGYTTYECETCKNGYSNTKPLNPNNHTGEGTYVIGNQAPTCATLGSTGIEKCSGCDATLSTKLNDIPVDFSNHENMKDYEAKAATCQTEGHQAYRYCSACGTYEIPKVDISVKAHKFTTYTTNNDGTHTAICDTCDEKVAAPVTDTQNCSGGTANCVDAKVCTVCNTAYGTTDATNHKTVKTMSKKDSTCQTEGYEPYRYCEACDTVTDTIVTIEKKAHVYGSWSKVEGEDKHTRSCKTCKAGVAEIATETVACSGGVAYCNEQATCTTCRTKYGAVNPENHKTQTTTLKNVKEATCQEEGYTGDKYRNCCNTLAVKGQATEKLAHNFSIEVSRTPATCIKTGSVTKKCSTCVETEEVKAETNTETLPIDAKNHASAETEVIGKVDATCESNGYTGDKYYICCYDEDASDSANKKALHSKGTVIKANGQHIYGTAVPEYMIEKIDKDADGNAVIVSKTSEPSYKDKIAARHSDSKWYHAKICTICDAVVYEACYTYAHTYSCINTDICEVCDGLCSLIDPARHILVKINGTAATENDIGTKAYYECSDCKECFLDAAGSKKLDLTDADGNGIADALEIPKLPAVAPDCVWVEDETKYVAPTCIETGKKVYECEECDNTKEVIIPATGSHTWEDAEGNKNYVVTEEPTCGKNGYKAIMCAVEGCGAIKSNSYVAIPVEGEHDYKLIDETEGKSCTDPAILTYECDVCGDTYTVESTEGVSAHAWGEWITKGGDCSTGVVQVRTCSTCKLQERRTLTDVEHTLVINARVDANCEKEGYIDRVCKNCGFVAEREIIPAISADNEHVVDLEHYKTLSKATCESAEKRQYTCTLCNEKVVMYHGTTLDHVWLLQKAEKATCTKDGHGEYYRCVRCEKAEVEPEIYKATGHVDGDNDGKCDGCGGVFYKDSDKPCSCICHNESFFMSFIYKIVSFFWKLFKINPSCACGNAHY